MLRYYVSSTKTSFAEQIDLFASSRNLQFYSNIITRTIWAFVARSAPTLHLPSTLVPRPTAPKATKENPDPSANLKNTILPDTLPHPGFLFRALVLKKGAKEKYYI